MYAIIETGGKQYRVKEGDVITVEKLKEATGEKVTFDKVLAMGEGSDIKIGTPYLDASVFGQVVETGKGKKITIYKYKAKKDYRKKQGHRQPFTAIEITGIGQDKPKAKKAEAKKEVKAEDKPADSEKPEVAKEEKATTTGTASMSMKKDELIAFAKEKNITIDAKATKQVILDTINENLK